LTTLALSFHAGYACRSSGACCSSNWPIPVEPETEAQITAALAAGALRLPRPHAGPPIDTRHLLAADRRGRCVFFDPAGGRRCSIQSALGHDSLPAACRHFPRVARIERARVLVTLSHYCPTAAALLQGHVGPTAIVADPPAFPPTRDYEGLDVRGAQPLLRPDALIGEEALDRFERHAALSLANGMGPVTARLGSLRLIAERLAAWQASDGPLEERLAVLLQDTPSGREATFDPDRAERLWEEVVSCVPARPLLPGLPAAWTSAWEDLVAPKWPGAAPVVGRYLAARAFASWCAYQGAGVRASVRALEAALAVLAIECARACAASGRELGDEQVVDALRQSDLLLTHLVDPLALARRLSAVEHPRR
jgi:Fe-S-cluster containining protein